MVYVIIEINGFTPLEKIDKSFTVKIINNLNKILESNTCTARKQYGSFFLYNYSPGLEDLKDCSVKYLKHMIISFQYVKN